MFPGATDRPAQSKDQSNEAQNAFAQFLTGEARISESNRSAIGSIAQGASESAQKMLASNAKDMNAGLAEKGHIPHDDKVADLSTATDTDRSAPIQAMMAPDHDKLNAAMDNALQNVEKKEAA